MIFQLGGAHINLLLLGVLGFSAGVLSGFFGVGGGFIVTPALNTLGAPMGLAIGTALADTLGTSAIGGLKHRKLGHIDFKLGLILVLSMLPAVELGKRLVMFLTNIGMAGDLVRYVYIVLLAGLGIQMLWSYLKRERSPITKTTQRERARFHVPPMISIREMGGGKVSLWIPVGLGLGIGVLAGFLGVGGGFILVPILCMMGVSAATAAGTALFTILLGSGAYGTFTYGLSSQVSLGAAMVMVLGASLGAQIGARATVHAAVKKFSFLFSILLLVVAVSVILKQLSTVKGWSFFSGYSPDILLCAAIGMSLFITAFLIMSGRAHRTGEATFGRAEMTNLVKRLAGKVAAASSIGTDKMLESRDWPYLWRK